MKTNTILISFSDFANSLIFQCCFRIHDLSLHSATLRTHTSSPSLLDGEGRVEGRLAEFRRPGVRGSVTCWGIGATWLARGAFIPSLVASFPKWDPYTVTPWGQALADLVTSLGPAEARALLARMIAVVRWTTSLLEGLELSPRILRPVTTIALSNSDAPHALSRRTGAPRASKLLENPKPEPLTIAC